MQTRKQVVDQVNKTVCYCYQYSDDDIRREVRENRGRSLILERIIAEKSKGACDCAAKHPEGR